MWTRGMLGSVAIVVAVIGCLGKPKTHPAPAAAQPRVAIDSAQCHKDALIRDTVLYGQMDALLRDTVLYSHTHALIRDTVLYSHVVALTSRVERCR